MSAVLSVIIPSFNQSSFIDINLSVLNYYGDDIEALVVDNESTDGTKSIVSKYKKIFDISIFEKDRGQAHAINKGVMLSGSDWVSFQNSDDYYDAIGLKSIIEFLKSEESEAYDLIISGTSFVDESGVITNRSSVKKVPAWSQSVRNHLNNQSIFFRRNLFDEAGGFDEDLVFCMDYDFFTKVLVNHNPKIKYFKINTGFQRFHSNTKTSKLKEIHDKEFRLVRSRYFSNCEIFLNHLSYPFYKAYRLYATAYSIIRHRL